MNNLQAWRYVQGERHAGQMSGVVQLKVKKNGKYSYLQQKTEKIILNAIYQWFPNCEVRLL